MSGETVPKNLATRLLNPLLLALMLNILVAVACFIWGSDGQLPNKIIEGWISGFTSLMAFAMQMILMLALGHAVAIAPAFLKKIRTIAIWIAHRRTPAFWVTILTALFAWLHWGLGLIAGGILARHVAQQGDRTQIPVYTAAAYGGFIVWHGGWSGSAPLLVATPGHFLVESIGIIPIQDTLLSNLNIILLIVTVLVAALTVALAQRSVSIQEQILPVEVSSDIQTTDNFHGIWAGLAIMSILIIAVSWKLQTIDLNFMIIILFSLAMLLHRDLDVFSAAVKDGLEGTVGIVIQFPLYGAIMGMMKSTGLAILIAHTFVSGVSPVLFPAAAFLSAGFLNMVVPSGGGQWAIQGPILMEVAQQLHVDIALTVIAFSWGDAWTNLIQPFWALPLLAITRTRIEDIFPLTATICVTTGIAIVAILCFSIIPSAVLFQ